MSTAEQAWGKHFQDNPEYEYPGTSRETFLAGYEAGRSEAAEQAATIAEQDHLGVTMLRLSDFPVVEATGKRIAFNIRARAQRSTP